jgi:20S proteasome subunit beta 1
MFTYVYALLPVWGSIDDHDRQTSGSPPPVHTAAALFQKLCYENKDALSAGIIVAGWDKEVGPSVYTIPVGGGLFRQPWAIGGEVISRALLTTVTDIGLGSGSAYVFGYCDATYQEGWGRDQTINFVKNSTFFLDLFFG